MTKEEEGETKTLQTSKADEKTGKKELFDALPLSSGKASVKIIIIIKSNKRKKNIIIVF